MTWISGLLKKHFDEADDILPTIHFLPINQQLS